MLERRSRQGARGDEEAAIGSRREIRKRSQQIAQTSGFPGVVGEPVSGEIQGDRLHLELAGNLGGQSCPGVDIDTGLMEQERNIRLVAPTQPAQDRSPGKLPLDCLRAERGPVAQVPHSLCL